MSRNGVTITLVDNPTVKGHSFRDYGLLIQNTDYIGNPVLCTQYVSVPGRSSFLDLSEVVAKRPVYESRPISVELAGFRETLSWDRFMSSLRNTYSGKIVMLVFDNDPNWYWIGRAELTAFKRERSMGSFVLSIPHADPYKYYCLNTTEPWLWDSFSFEDGIITGLNALTANGSSHAVTESGNYYWPDFILYSNYDSILFEGNATISISYRKGSL